MVPTTRSPSSPDHANEAPLALLNDAKHCFFSWGFPVQWLHSCRLQQQSPSPSQCVPHEHTHIFFFSCLVPWIALNTPRRITFPSIARPLLQPGCTSLANSGPSGGLSPGGLETCFWRAGAPAFLPHVLPPLMNITQF